MIHVLYNVHRDNKQDIKYLSSLCEKCTTYNVYSTTDSFQVLIKRDIYAHVHAYYYSLVPYSSHSND